MRSLNPIGTVAAVSLFLAMVGSTIAAPKVSVVSPAVVLTNASQIRNLTVSESSRFLPVRLRGVVVSEASPVPSPSGAPDRLHGALVLSDETAAIYMIGPVEQFSNFRHGDYLEVEGVTDPGQFAPFVVAKSARRLGTAQVPLPLPVTYQQLITGGLDAQWVELSGVVRSWEPIVSDELYGDWRMVLAVDGNKVAVAVNGPRPTQLEPDATVRIRSVCFYQFNQQRQVLSPALLVSREVPIIIETPAPADPYATPVRSVASTLQFAPENVYGHRVHLHGVVTFQQPGTTIWIRDDSGAAGIQTQQADVVAPGDEIDVLGFPKYGSSHAALEDAVFKKARSARRPVPIALATPNEAFDHDADLISLETLLTDVQPILGGHTLTLKEGGKTFHAVIKSATPEAPITWISGSRVRVTGICSVIRDESSFVMSGIWHPQSFQILLRSADDLHVVAPPPWWTPKHIILLLGIVAVISSAMTAGSLWFTRRHVREQAMRRAMAESEFAAILSERNRMAREIHDTLAQGLTATLMQLRLAKKNVTAGSSEVCQHLDAADQLIGASLEEARNSIWNMRSHVLENGDLVSALNNVLKQLCDGTGIETQCEATGKIRRLAPVIEDNLLRLGQEAITNSIKHARASRIVVKLGFGDQQFHLIVKDNGCGFETANSAPGEGSFGLVGMRERTEQLKGELAVNSKPGGGTEIKLTVPLSGE